MSAAANPEQIITDAFSGRPESPEALALSVYEELRRLARAYMRRERADHTLQATALVNEAWLRLFAGEPFQWENRQQLFCVLARGMRRVLVDHARHHRADRHGGALHKTALGDHDQPVFRDPVRLIAVSDAIERLERLNPRQAQVVELHFLAGLTEEEVAEVLN